jgi:hypothetical protein
MGQRRARPRHVVSRRTITILKALGYRHSTTRRAWVHRLFGGNRGPVFRSEDEFEPLGKPRALSQASRALASEPLRRIPARAEDGMEAAIALPFDLTADDAPSAADGPASRRRPGRHGARRPV